MGMSLNVFQSKNNIFFNLVGKFSCLAVLISLVLPIETFALTANNSGTSSVYSDRIRPSSFYGLSANDIQTHGASSITPGNSNGGVVASSNSAPRYSASSNSITPGSQNNSNFNVVSFSNTAVISVPNVTSQSYFSDSYGADSYETLASGNNNVPGENFGNESLDSGDPLYASAISNESYFNDSESDSPNRSGSYQSESINGEDFSSSNLYGDNERSSSFASSNTRSGSFSSGSTKSASVYSGVVKPASVRNVVSTPTKQVLTQAGMNVSKSPSPTNEDIVTILAKEKELAGDLLPFLASLQTPAIDIISVTYGPGLEPALWVGINCARALSLAWNVPIVPSNHMEGHILISLLGQEKEKNASVPATRLIQHCLPSNKKQS
jgi:hypothetical protein